VKIFKFIYIFLVASILIGCQPNDENEKPDSDINTKEEAQDDLNTSGDQPKESIDSATLTSASFKVSLESASSLGYQISRISAKLYNNSYSQEQEFAISDNTASGEFNELSPGNYTLNIKAYQGEKLVATAESSVTITAGEIISKQITLQYITGALSVDVTWDDPTDIVDNSSTSQPFLDFTGTTHSISDYTDDIRVFGEVKNNSNASSYSFVKVSCDFYDTNEALLGNEYTYLYGNCGKLASLGKSTNTVLFPGETGAWELITDISATTVANYTCKIEFSDSQLIPLLSNMVVTDVVTSNNIINYLELDGTVTNTGTSPLVFGKVYSVIRNSSAQVINISFSYIDGENIYLSSISDYTDTGLSVNGTGSFHILTTADFTDVSDYKLTTCGDDHEENSISKPKTHYKTFNRNHPVDSEKDLKKLRVKEINDLLQQLNN